MIYSREGMRHQCWSLVIVSTERGRQVGDVVLHHGLPRSRGSPVYRRGHGESVFACASTLVRRGEYRAQTGIWRLLGFVSARTIKGRSIDWLWPFVMLRATTQLFPRIPARDDDPSFIVLTETKFSFRCIPVWDRYSPHRTRVEKKNTCDNALTMTSPVHW